MHKTFKVFLISSRPVRLDRTSTFGLFVHREDVMHEAPSIRGGCCWVFRLLPICTDSLVEDVMHSDRTEHCRVECEPLPPVCINGQLKKKFTLEGQVQDTRAMLLLAGVMMWQEVITALNHRDKAKGSHQGHERDTDSEMFVFNTKMDGLNGCKLIICSVVCLLSWSSNMFKVFIYICKCI